MYVAIGLETRTIYAMGNTKEQCVNVLFKRYPQLKKDGAALGEPIRIEVRQS